MRTVLLTIALFAGCDRAPVEPSYSATPPPGVREPLVFGVHPLHNPRRLERLFGPVASKLEQCLERPVRLEASRSYSVFEAKLQHGAFDLALPNPYQTMQARRFGYEVFAKQGQDEQFRGVLLTRRADAVPSLEWVRGKTVAFPAPTALAAAMMPQLFLARAGLARGSYEAKYVGSQESAIDAVLRGDAAVGVTWAVPWEQFQVEHPDRAATLEVRWETTHLVNNALVAHGRLDAETVARARDCLVHFADDEAGQATLKRMAAPPFEPATDETYDRVREVFAAFQREVGEPTP
jgi:phosphonate transport system substrate-binding protein